MTGYMSMYTHPKISKPIFYKKPFLVRKAFLTLVALTTILAMGGFYYG